MWWTRKESPPAAPPVARAEWRGVPPIRRVLAEHPLVNPVQRFSASLTSWQSPAYLEPLGHQVGPDEPAGVIGDLARPRTLETPTPAMPVVQRATRKRSGLSRLWGGATVQREVLPEAVPEPVFAPEPTPEPPPLVLPAVAAREDVRPLTSAQTVVPPVRTVQAIVEPSPVDTPVAPVPAPALPVVQRGEQATPRRLGLGAPISPGQLSPAAPLVAAEAGVALSGATGVEPVQRFGEPSLVNTFRPLETPEPPGPPGGSTSVSPPPEPALPVARAVEGAEAPVARAATSDRKSTRLNSR